MQPFRPSFEIAYFITPHGFGHAARSAAVIEALHARLPGAQFSLFTTVPKWFFDNSLTAPYEYHPICVDVGLVQRTPLIADLDKTRAELERFIPFDPMRVDSLAGQLSDMSCDLVVCDVSPLGIAAARQAGIESVLIENFTWDWVYSGIPGLASHAGHLIEYLEHVYAQADYRIQTEPLCNRVDADRIVGPVSRPPRRSADQIRDQLSVAAETKLVLVTMGGVAQNYRFLEASAVPDRVHLVVSGGSEQVRSTVKVTWLPMNSDYYHPDLMHASDAVIAKVGYSTLAEAFNSGVPFGYIRRPDFKESEILAGFVESRMSGFQISPDAFFNGSWIHQIRNLLTLPRLNRNAGNGAHQIAEFMVDKICRKPNG